MRRLPRHPAPGSVAVGGLRRQPEIQHQVSQEVPRPEEGQQGPEGSGRHPQHQRRNSGECEQTDTKGREQKCDIECTKSCLPSPGRHKHRLYLSPISLAAIFFTRQLHPCHTPAPSDDAETQDSQTNAPLFAAVVGLGG